ncbi:MAG: polysaccharide biosynthesis protein [Acetobacter sp.]|nr:polysaccharide biosynthesis protein [Bacteroides sp.]MCM1341555.1 polysaccharide biosynthesis protein [Acetobacter sp.]MCM1433632.1 polysaccharide biosynthesis protein [Clostridiales bacterium]
MKIERSKNSIRNLFFGTISKIYNLIIPFLMRTAIIYLLGMEYLGLSSLFASVLSVLNLAELGIGSALVFSMYEPVANDDGEKICALMRLYKIYYRVIGIVILVIGIAITPFLPNLVKGEIPSDMNIYILYYLNLVTTAISYWLFAYKNCLLSVHQRYDVGDKIGYVINTVKYLGQFLVLLIFKNYYLYLIVATISGVVSNLTTARIVDKIYPQYKAMGKLPKDEVKKINRKVADLFTSKIGSIVYDSADTIVISAFLGLIALAKFQNYFFVMNTIFGFVSLITSSSLAGIGNSLITESEEKNFNDLKKITLIISWISAFCVCCFACLYQPFMTLWVGEDNLLPYGMVVVFCSYFIIRQINNLLNVYKDAAGMWHEDKWRPLTCSLVNLVFNIILVQFWGLYGILLSTIASMVVVGMPWLTHNLFTTVFHCNPKKYIIDIIKYLLLTAICAAICIGITNIIKIESNIITIIVNLIICAIVPNAIFFILFRKREEFKSVVRLINNITKGKIKFLKRFI